MKRRTFLAGLVASLALATVPLVAQDKSLVGTLAVDECSGNPEKIIYYTTRKMAEFWYPAGTSRPATAFSNSQPVFRIYVIRLSDAFANDAFSVSDSITCIENADGTKFSCHKSIVAFVNGVLYCPKAVWIISDPSIEAGINFDVSDNRKAHWYNDN